MTTISAKTVLRSCNTARPDKVVSTLLLRYPRWIHAEQRTHRVIPLGEDEDFYWAPSTPSLMADPNLSRNAGSSRATPVKKLIDDVLADPAEPLFWGQNIAGMQSNEELSPAGVAKAKKIWNDGMIAAVDTARRLSELGHSGDGAVVGAHKQIANRVPEPYSHITVLISATEWGNFLELRDHGDAEPHIAMLAREIRKCLDDESTIQWLEPGDWHLPFVDKNDWHTLTQLTSIPAERRDIARKISFARCASTSYKTVDGFDMSYERAVALHDRLLSRRPIHASPAEHVCQADEPIEYQFWKNPRQHGNFEGFRQYRHMLAA